jgi:hypothetical protein
MGYHDFVVKSEKREVFLLLVGTWCVVCIVVVAYGYFLHLLLPSSGGWDKSGVFGDSFGALNTAFTGMALSGILFAVFAQMRTQRQQQIELSHQQEQLEKQQNQLDEQYREQLLQRSVKLFEEWQGETIHMARTAVHGLTNGFEKIKSLSEYEADQTRLLSTGGGNQEEKRFQANQIRQLFTVVYFYQKMAFLLEEGLLDKRASHKLLEDAARAYAEKLLRPLLENEKARMDHTGNWIELLERIDRVISADWKS